MTPTEFIAKWRDPTLKERSASQEHFIDLCRLVGVKTPVEADPHGDWFTFEKGLTKTGGGQGWADVWRKGHFAWEYKGKRKDLIAALRQLQQYAPALDHPPLLITSDMDVIEIHTAWTDTVVKVYHLTLDDLADPDSFQKLKWAFTEPERLKPTRTREGVTKDAATLLGGLAQRLRQRGHPPAAVAHFLTRLVFCLFAEDIGLLPDRLFTDLLDEARRQPPEFPALAGALFQAMHQGGRFGLQRIAWFNGGLFNDATCLPLDRADLDILHSAAALDWSAIEPAIFGTLFERGLDPNQRAQLGAHYTDADSIRRLIEPVISAPLRVEWATVQTAIAAHLGKTSTKARTAATDRLHHFLERLRTFRVLDPACGSGNFLYLALRALKDLEHQVGLEAEALGLPRSFATIGPDAVLGIEINPYAAELARLTVWIGEIQWMLGHGYNLNDQPILKPLDTIECRDALLTPEGDEAAWPAADVIIGNPPFLGGSKLRRELGDEYTERVRQTYAERVPAGADLVCYWFEKARAQIEAGQAQRAGLVATNSIRGGANRKVLARICTTGTIFHAWSDEPWINEGAAVRVSLIGFGRLDHGQPVILDGHPVTAIHADLTAATGNSDNPGADLTQAQPLAENAGLSFQGSQKIGAFDIPGALARQWLPLPNPHGRPNAEVLKPSWNGLDLTRRPRDGWIIDFGVDRTEADAALYEQPFQYVVQRVKPDREQNNRPIRAKYWWRHGDPQPAMRAALAPLTRYLATPHVSKHRIFIWLPTSILPDKMLIVVARDDDATFGILNSRFHELWALRLGTSLGPTPRYTSSTTFETFPFPSGLTPNLAASAYADDPHAQAIAVAARRLDELRSHWLNPPEWVDRVPEIVPGYPDRLIPKPAHAADLKHRTLTALYNARPAWLVNVHHALDVAVAAAYGWPNDLSDEEVLRRLLALNQERAG